MNQKKKRFRKILIALRLTLCGNGYKKAEYLKQKKVFNAFGDNNYWFPKIIPADPEMVSIHNNVKIATDVYFCTHDVLHNLFNDAPDLRGGGTSGILSRLRYLTMYLSERNLQLCMV